MYSDMLKSFGDELSSFYPRFDPLSSPLVFIGGGGFIGITLTRLAQDLGFKSLSIDMSTPISPELHNFLEIDAFDVGNFREINSKIDKGSTVVILATPFIVSSRNLDQVPSSMRQDDFFSMRIFRYYKGIIELLRFIGSKCKRIVYISSFDVYGSLHMDAKSISGFEKLEPYSPYAVSKISGEMASAVAAKENSCLLRIIRPSQVIGRGEGVRYNRLIPHILREFQNGKHVSLKLALDASRQYVSVYQVFAHLLDSLVSESSQSCIRNCVGSQTKIEDIVNICREIVGKGSYSVETVKSSDFYTARVEGHSPLFLSRTFELKYLEHISAVIEEQFESIRSNEGK